MKINKKILYNLLLCLLIFNLFIGVDFYQKLFFEKLRIIPDVEFILIMAVFSLFCAFIPNVALIFITFILFVMEITEFINFAYFGDFISPTAIGLIISEAGEIIGSGASAFQYVYKIILIPILLYGLLLLFLKLNKNNRFISGWAIIPVVVILSITPIKVIKNHNFSIFYPDQTMHTMRNGIYSFSAYLFKILPSQFGQRKLNNEYQKYEIEKIKDSDNKNVILVIGESVNYEHMSIYGYPRDTNVELAKLLYEGMIVRKGISSSTSTKISLPLILNSIREPNNQLMLDSKEANLFKLAKENGFQTIYISAQESVLSRAIGAGYIDFMTVFENEKEIFEKIKDEGLIEVLNKIKPAEKNFIVLHMRSSHSPYEYNYSNRPEFRRFDDKAKSQQDYVTNSYDNTMIFNDFLLKKMIDHFKITLPSFSFFFTSDHGEMLGEGGLFGHVNFNINATKVPFLYYSDKKDDEFIKNISDNLTHYELSLMVANKLGYKINNPNIKDEKLFFIHGNNHNNVYEVLDYFEVLKDKDTVSYNYKKIE